MKKELAYLLGYFYADGYLHNHKGKYNYPKIEIVKSDGESILNCLNSIGSKYSTRFRFRKNSKNEQVAITIAADDENINLFRNVLSDKINMSNILSTIKHNDLNYFIRGFFDGDGCINIAKNTHARLYLYGSYEQDWSLIFNILKKLDIKYTYQQIIRKNGKHKSSLICVSNRHGINLFYEYIYPDRIYDFGLKRKYDKLNIIKSLVKSEHIRQYQENQSAEVLKEYT